MAVFEPAGRRELVLQVQAPTSDPGTFFLVLDDGAGHDGSGVFAFDPDRRLATGGTWGEFLRDYLEKDPSADRLAAFGRDLFRAVVEELGDVRDAWSAARGAAGREPLALTVELGRQTERFAALPLELLADGVGFLFARPGGALRRAYRETPPRAFRAPASPRVLFASACPPLAGDRFDPEPHAEALGRVFGDGGLERLNDATLESIRARLAAAREAGEPFSYLHLLVHGYRDVATAGVCLATTGGAPNWVDSQSLARTIYGPDLELVFLCSCRTAVAGGEAFSGVGQQLVSPWGGDLPCVVATQANLPVDGSAELGERFYRQLAACGDPAAALADARRLAYARGGRAWSVPVLITRPVRRAVAVVPVAEVAGLPARRSTYLERPELEGEVLAALGAGRLVSLVGLPGIGKTEIGREAARRAVAAGLADQVVYREAHEGMDTEALRLLVGTALGLAEPAADDAALAAAFEAMGRSVLLLIDNAEDLMRTDRAQAEFRAQIDSLLDHSRRLRILLTTRWQVGALAESERQVDVPPLLPAETADLLARELRSLGVFDEAWPASPAWRELLELIDGHPRAMWLVSRHFADRRATLEGVRDRLLARKEDAVVAPDLLGREDAFRALGDDKKARLRSLVATMDLSFEVLEERHPDAVEAFVALSLFPGGLPETVAQAVTGGVESLALNRLYHYHLVEWHQERTFYPVPLHWYAERQRRQRTVDENLYRRRALDGFAQFAEDCDQLVTGDSIVVGVDRLLQERQALEELAAWAEHRLPATGEGAGSEGAASSPSARIACAARNSLHLAHQHGTAELLARAGLLEARALGDRAGEANCLKSLGDLQMRLSDLDRARGSYETALPIYREIQARLGEANCLKSLGDLQMRLSDFDGARESYETALPIYREIPNQLGVATCLKSLGDLQIRLSDLDGARESYEAALPIYHKIRDRLGEANCLKSLGDLRMRLSNFDGARASYETALSIYREIRDRLGEANSLHSLGDLGMRLSDLDGARGSYEAALPIYREIRARLGEANCLQSLGDLRMRLDDLDGARGSYEAALPIYHEIRDRLGEANCRKSLGDLRMRLDDLDGARASYEAALPIYRETQARLGEANCLQSLGDLQMRISDLDGARTSYEAALPIYREIRARLGEANCLKSLGDLQMRLSDLDGARASYEAALRIYREIRARLGEANSLQSLGDLQMRLSDLDGARASYEAALPIYREIHDRLGEANCLQNLGLVYLASGQVAAAFRRFLELLDAFRSLSDGLGEQASLGYLARAAHAVGEADQALALAERSLAVGRRIDDPFGQTINLDLQIAIWTEAQSPVAVAAMILCRDLCREIGDREGAGRYEPILDQMLPALPGDLRQALEESPEEVRRQAVEEAEERLRASGRDPLTPPESTGVDP